MKQQSSIPEGGVTQVHLRLQMAPAQDLQLCIQNEAEQKQKGAITECLDDTKLNRKTLFSPIDKNKKDQTAYSPAPQLQKRKKVLHQNELPAFKWDRNRFELVLPTFFHELH